MAQRDTTQALAFQGGHALVLGAAGAGKRTIIQLAARVVQVRLLRLPGGLPLPLGHTPAGTFLDNGAAGTIRSPDRAGKNLNHLQRSGRPSVISSLEGGVLQPGAATPTYCRGNAHATAGNKSHGGATACEDGGGGALFSDIDQDV